MYILASDVFEKEDQYVFKAKIRVVYSEYIFIVFSKQIR